jgi:hypothetical protein
MRLGNFWPMASTRAPGAKRNKVASAVTFESVGRDWLTAQASSLSPPTLRKAFWMLETFVFKEVGSEAITKGTEPAVLKLY